MEGWRVPFCLGSCLTVFRTAWKAIPAAGAASSRAGMVAPRRPFCAPATPRTPRLHNVRMQRAWKAGGFLFHPGSCRTLFRTARRAIPAGGFGRLGKPSLPLAPHHQGQGWSLRAVRFVHPPPLGLRASITSVCKGLGRREDSSFTPGRAAHFFGRLGEPSLPEDSDGLESHPCRWRRIIKGRDGRSAPSVLCTRHPSDSAPP